MTSLPIEAIKANFLTTIQNKDVIVSAATGSGKSTCLPIWAAQMGRVLVIEPRRIACTSLAEYLAQSSGLPIGQKIGYAIRFETHFSAQTEVVFVTPGVALRWFYDNKLSDYNVVMIDEFHERRWDMDLILAMLKQRNQHRLIVTSATLGTSTLQSYLNANLLHSDGRIYPVEETFHAHSTNAMPTKDQLCERVIAACEQALTNTSGDILVFLPGKAEIQAAAAAAKALNKLIVQLYGGCTKQQQELALQVQTEQRVIFATNVAETSLTIPNVSCVIDSGLERRTHLRGDKTVLALDTIGRDSAKQRLGRAGRTQKGLCIRLYGQHAPLIDRTPPEITRENLTELVLAAACSSDGVRSLKFIEPLPEKSKNTAIMTLQRIGAIDEHNKATNLGKKLYPLPIDAELAHLIQGMPNNTLRQAMIDISALLSVPAKVYQLPTQLESRERLDKQYPNSCDLELAAAIVRGQAHDIRIETEALREARQFSELLREAFSLPELKHAASYDRGELLEAIATLKPASVFVKRQNKRGAYGNGSLEVIPAKESRINEQCQAMIVLDTYALAGKGNKQAVTLATLNAPIMISTIRQLNLGKYSFLNAELCGDTIMVNSAYQYAGVTLSEEKIVPDKAQFIQACSELILKGVLLPGAGQQVEDDLALTPLYYQAHNINEALPLAFDYICQRLVQLGVTEQSDIELIEASDLHFTQVEAWELTPFREKHPLQVQLNDLLMHVEYHFSAKRITLHHIKGKRKETPKRWELPAWPGFSIQYKKASRIIAVK